MGLRRTMSVVLLTLALSLLIPGCASRAAETHGSCGKWDWNETKQQVCCNRCHPGNRLVKQCSSNMEDLCTPCETNTYTLDPTQYSCLVCTQCVDPQIVEKPCTRETDTVCKCKAGLKCGNQKCSFCVKECGRGEEPEKRSCKPCPDGTFNDQIHQKCKRRSTSCPHPDESIVDQGTATSDIKCQIISQPPLNFTVRTTRRGNPAAWSALEFSLMILCLSLLSLGVLSFIVINAAKISKIFNKTKKTTRKTAIIRTPTDDPRTLIAVECSFHEAQQENGSSSESLSSKDSKVQLVS
ncbi:tumor necrosis factor receptor superfamily member 9a [Lampris incognitus]|uniref:tumor necrosis factor receptor superfamily member 9a n=1 Tax=Lampris incognitus TaxID=2546036 RepID=UPI0024B505E6|nr:tumor necrosis factor receptor superfamily member 9a [Lampris incognitus]